MNILNQSLVFAKQCFAGVHPRLRRDKESSARNPRGRSDSGFLPPRGFKVDRGGEPGIEEPDGRRGRGRRGTCTYSWSAPTPVVTPIPPLFAIGTGGHRGNRAVKSQGRFWCRARRTTAFTIAPGDASEYCQRQGDVAARRSFSGNDMAVVSSGHLGGAATCHLNAQSK